MCVITWITTQLVRPEGWAVELAMVTDWQWTS